MSGGLTQGWRNLDRFRSGFFQDLRAFLHFGGRRYQ
jgi:hypothetical protein